MNAARQRAWIAIPDRREPASLGWLSRSTSVTGLLVSFVFRFALFHQITVLARHRMRLKALLAHFSSTGIGVGGG
jgi:hypothetical protein